MGLILDIQVPHHDFSIKRDTKMGKSCWNLLYTGSIIIFIKQNNQSYAKTHTSMQFNQTNLRCRVFMKRYLLNT